MTEKHLLVKSLGLGIMSAEFVDSDIDMVSTLKSNFEDNIEEILTGDDKLFVLFKTYHPLVIQEVRMIDIDILNELKNLVSINGSDKFKDRVVNLEREMLKFDAV